MFINLVPLLLASVTAQSFNFNINLINLPASGVASGSLQLTWTFNSCGSKDSTDVCPLNQDASVIPAGLTRMILRQGDFQNPKTNGDVDLLAGIDAIAGLTRGMNGAVYTLALPAVNDLYSVYMEAIDSNSNPIIGISPIFSVGPVQNAIALITPVQGSVYFTETFDDPYLIRWFVIFHLTPRQYIGLTAALTPDSFSIDLLNTADAVVAQIYIRSRFNFPESQLTGLQQFD
jgi:hypothetical protein